MEIYNKQKRPALGIQDFREVREGNYYYIDKTKMLEEFLERGAKVTLVTRPRRFGKTLNMSMMAEFLDITKDSHDIFSDTAIMDTEFACEINQYPVIFLSFCNVKGSTRESLLMNLSEALLAEFRRYRFIWQEGKADDVLKNDLENIFQLLQSSDHMDQFIMGRVMYAVQKLSLALEQQYGKKVYIFLDEYDAPFIEAHVNGFYEDIHDLLSTLLSSALKGNSSLKAAMLTGIQRVAKENIFSGLNNLLVCTVKDPEFSDCFGFTAYETKELLDYYGQEFNAEVRAMYDGYSFYKTDIYNPWSIINYAQRGILEPYWVNTSENKMIRLAMEQCGSEFYDAYEALIREGAASVVMYVETSFYENPGSPSLWGLLLNAGMVTIEEVMPMEYFRVRIPNYEVRSAFAGLTESYLRVKEGTLGQLFGPLLHLDLDGFAREYKRVIMELPSYHDLKDENSYHMMMLGMCAFLSREFKVTSNRESGKGRCDILLEARSSNYPHIIMEFKYTADNTDLTNLARRAILQIMENEYDHGLAGKVLYIGLAHKGKEARVQWKFK